LREHGDFNSHERLSEKGTLFWGGGQRNKQYVSQWLRLYMYKFYKEYIP
jgi:hypothetical protein